MPVRMWENGAWETTYGFAVDPDTKANLAGAAFTGPVSAAVGVTITDDNGTLVNGLRSMLTITPPTTDDEVVGLLIKVPDNSWGVGQDYTEGNFEAFLSDADGSSTVAGVPLLRTITGTTDATPVVVTTSVAHGFSTGDVVRISQTGIPALDGGATALHVKWWKITVLSSTTFSLNESVAPGSAAVAGYAFTDRNPVLYRIADSGGGVGGGWHIAPGLRNRSGFVSGGGIYGVHIDMHQDGTGLLINNAKVAAWGPAPAANYITVMDVRAANAVRFSVNAAGQTTIDPGTVALPSLSFVGDIDTGIFRQAADVISVATGGVERARISSTGVIANPGLATSAYVGSFFGFPAAVMGSANDTAVYRVAAAIVSPWKALQMGAAADGTTFIDMREQTATSNPAADYGRLQARDVGGVTALYWRRSDGTETRLDV